MSLNINATAVPPSMAALYANTDFNQLNWFEQQWAAWYLWIGNPIIATGLASFLLHEVCWTILPFCACCHVY
jgi:methylsterol monooxygenase